MEWWQLLEKLEKEQSALERKGVELEQKIRNQEEDGGGGHTSSLLTPHPTITITLSLTPHTHRY